jgi:hypothetical protein
LTITVPKKKRCPGQILFLHAISYVRQLMTQSCHMGELYKTFVQL